MAENTSAADTMVKNIETKAGMTIAQLAEVVAQSGLTKHGDIRSMLMERFDFGYGQANTVVHLALRSDGGSAAADRGLSHADVLDEIYEGKKAHLRPVHDRVLAVLDGLGSHEVAPKKGYVSYRRKKQFLMVGPKTNSAVELGFGAKSLPAHERLKEMPANSMCRYTTRVGGTDEVDALVQEWIRVSYDEAG